MDALEDIVIHPTQEFIKDSRKFINNCKKPDVDEFSSASIATFIGLILIGAIGVFVKLIFIPLNNIIVGGK